MADQESSKTNTGSRTRRVRSTDLKKLHDAVTEMDSMSQDAFTQIAGIARLALNSMEDPDVDHADIAAALKAIWEKAKQAEHYINVAAEDVGCDYVNEAELRRWHASVIASDSSSQTVDGGRQHG